MSDPRVSDRPQHGRASSQSSLLEALKEHLISFATMDPPLRFISALAIAQLFAAAVLVALSNFSGPLRIADVKSGAPIYAHEWVFMASILSLALAWSFVITGALQAHWSVLLVVLGIFSYVVGADQMVVFAGVGHAVASARALIALRVGVIVTVSVFAFGGWLSARKRKNESGGWSLNETRSAFTLAFFAGMLCAYYALVFRYSAFIDPDLFSRKISHQMRNVALIVTPALLLAATDWVEMLEVSAEWLSHTARRFSLGLIGLAGAAGLFGVMMGWRGASEEIARRLHQWREDPLWLVYRLAIIGAVTFPLLVALRRVRIGRCPGWKFRFGRSRWPP